MAEKSLIFPDPKSLAGHPSIITAKSIMPTPIDLTTVAEVKSWLSASGTASSITTDDVNIQACITAFSLIFLTRTGRLYNGQIPTDNSNNWVSPFVQVCTFNEWYDGYTSHRLYLRNNPIQSVISLVIGNYTVPQSTAYNLPGYVISGDQKFLALRNRAGANSFGQILTLGCGPTFKSGIQSINVQYTAGYSSTPPDILYAATKYAAAYYKRRNWIDVVSQALAQGAGQATITLQEEDKDITRLIYQYTNWTI